ncbi:unnamed protein product, partial [Dovyalis caffra]
KWTKWKALKELVWCCWDFVLQVFDYGIYDVVDVLCSPGMIERNTGWLVFFKTQQL